MINRIIKVKIVKLSVRNCRIKKVNNTENSKFKLSVYNTIMHRVKQHLISISELLVNR